MEKWWHFWKAGGKHGGHFFRIIFEPISEKGKVSQSEKTSASKNRGPSKFQGRPSHRSSVGCSKNTTWRDLDEKWNPLPLGQIAQLLAVLGQSTTKFGPRIKSKRSMALEATRHSFLTCCSAWRTQPKKLAAGICKVQIRFDAIADRAHSHSSDFQKSSCSLLGIFSRLCLGPMAYIFWSLGAVHLADDAANGPPENSVTVFDKSCLSAKCWGQCLKNLDGIWVFFFFFCLSWFGHIWPLGEARGHREEWAAAGRAVGLQRLIPSEAWQQRCRGMVTIGCPFEELALNIFGEENRSWWLASS